MAPPQRKRSKKVDKTTSDHNLNKTMLGMSQHFEFINLIDRPQIHDAEAKKIVRAHAMRDFRRRKVKHKISENRDFKKSSNVEVAEVVTSPSVTTVVGNGVFNGPATFIHVGGHAKGQLLPADIAGELMDHVGGHANGQLLPADIAGGLMDEPPLGLDEEGKDENVALDGTFAVEHLPWDDSVVDAAYGLGYADPDIDFDRPPEPFAYQPQNESLPSTPAMLSSPGAGSPDPFNALPITGTERVHFLMRHYVSVFIKTGTPMIPQQTWINEAVKDPALFQATLLPAAVHHALLHDLNLSESFELFQNTTRTVSTKLSDREQGISDTNLAAVVCLSFVENVLGNSSASKVHVEGLKRMVELRGGLHALGLNGVLQRMILWADNWTGILSLTKPRFPVVQKVKATPALTRPTIAVDSMHVTSFPRDDSSDSSSASGSDEHQEDVFDVIRGLQRLSRTLAAVHVGITTHQEATLFNESVFMLERQLLLSLTADEHSHLFPLDGFMLQSFSHAAYIFIYSTLHSTMRDLPLKCPFFGIFVERLEKSLNDPDLLSAWSQTNPVMLLWVLVVGAVAAFKRPQRRWFITQLAEHCVSMKIFNLGQMKGLLADTMWVDGALDSALKTLWTEIQGWLPYRLGGCSLSDRGFVLEPSIA